MSSFKPPTNRNFLFDDLLWLARNWKNRPGFVFFETSKMPGMSFVAAQPEKELTGNNWELLEEEFSRRAGTQKLEEGAAIGFFRYDGSFHFGFYPQIHIFNQPSPRLPLPPVSTPVDPITTLKNLPSALSGPVTSSAAFSTSLTPDMEETHFLHMVSRAQEYIAAGDIYQVCLAHRFSGKFEGNFWNYYEALRNISPAPYSAFLRLGDTQVACTSPECFLHIRDRSIHTRPIKGTRPRHPDPERDSALAAELLASEKERAELIMITDLERNDLGKICIPGSVKVSDLLRLETYPQVFHLVSTVEGKLRNEISHIKAVKACFPGGSITGAPKKRAMEVIAELEPIPRGIYTGAIGFFGYNGESQFNIAIRTAVEKQGEISFHVGAGIVSDSNPTAEWEETLHKARGLLLAQGNFVS